MLLFIESNGNFCFVACKHNVLINQYDTDILYLSCLKIHFYASKQRHFYFRNIYKLEY